MMTEWRVIPGFEKYEASDDGRIRNAETKRELVAKLNQIKGRANDCLYLHVGLTRPRLAHEMNGGPKGGRTVKQCYRTVHRLVALAFVPNPDGKPFVNHIDCDRHNNHAANLEWVTAEENQAHAVKNGRYHGATNPRRVRLKTPEERKQIRERFFAGEKARPLATEFGVTPGYVYKLAYGPKSQAGVTAGMAKVKVTAEVAGRIKGLYASDDRLTKSEVARRIGVTPNTAARILNGQRWRDVAPIPPQSNGAPNTHATESE